MDKQTSNRFELDQLGQYYFSQNHQTSQDNLALSRCPRDIYIEGGECKWSGSKENSDPFYQVYVQELTPKEEEIQRYEREGIRQYDLYKDKSKHQAYIKQFERYKKLRAKKRKEYPYADFDWHSDSESDDEGKHAEHEEGCGKYAQWPWC